MTYYNNKCLLASDTYSQIDFFLIKTLETVVLIKYMSKAKLHFASEAYSNYYILTGQQVNLTS